MLTAVASTLLNTKAVRLEGVSLTPKQVHAFCDHVELLIRARVYDTQTFTLLMDPQSIMAIGLRFMTITVDQANIALTRKQFSEQLISALADYGDMPVDSEALLLSKFEKVFTHFYNPHKNSWERDAFRQRQRAELGVDTKHKGQSTSTIPTKRTRVDASSILDKATVELTKPRTPSMSLMVTGPDSSKQDSKYGSAHKNSKFKTTRFSDHVDKHRRGNRGHEGNTLPAYSLLHITCNCDGTDIDAMYRTCCITTGNSPTSLSITTLFNTGANPTSFVNRQVAALIESQQSPQAHGKRKHSPAPLAAVSLAGTSQSSPIYGSVGFNL